LSYSIEQASSQADSLDMAQLLQEAEPFKTIRRGDLVNGEVARIDEDGIIIYIGHKADGIVPLREMRSLTADDLENIKIGDELYTVVVRPDSEEGPAILSIDRAKSEQGWTVLQRALDNSELIAGTITGYNKGGAIVDIEGIQAFIPLSQLAPTSQGADSQEDLLAQRMGQEVKGYLLEVNRRRNRVILSERQAVHKQREEQKDKLLEELEEGQIRKGRVSGISNFGVFVDLGGADGLIHISELSWSQVQSPEELVKTGTEIDVYVLKVDRENRKIALSLKRMEPEPWVTVADNYAVGQLVGAVVTKLTNFGAFARIDGVVEGLIHISELSEQMIQHPNEVVNSGDEVTLKIIRIEPERRRLGLSLKQAVDPWDVTE